MTQDPLSRCTKKGARLPNSNTRAFLGEVYWFVPSLYPFFRWGYCGLLGLTVVGLLPLVCYLWLGAFYLWYSACGVGITVVFFSIVFQWD